MNTLARVYANDPYPRALTAAQRKYVKGIQLALWNEFIPNRNQLEYMLLPAAEVAWSKPENKNFEKFIERLNLGHFQSWSWKGCTPIIIHVKFAFSPISILISGVFFVNFELCHT
ncbi:family 20 glycosylhydrolase [Sphingobacterium sp. UBA6320]|uniref:family 20 glycosylhydrolase n=1 Tax=Sphingobacterium sp. UBA6320 TaxID=1947510 RepID=UPI0039C986A4